MNNSENWVNSPISQYVKTICESSDSFNDLKWTNILLTELIIYN